MHLTSFVLALRLGSLDSLDVKCIEILRQFASRLSSVTSTMVLMKISSDPCIFSKEASGINSNLLLFFIRSHAVYSFDST